METFTQDDVISAGNVIITPENVIPNAMRDLLKVALNQHMEILHYAQDDVKTHAQDDVITSGYVIPNAMRDLLDVALCLHVEILRYAQDDVITVGNNFISI
jgi:hypothetical protein